MEPAPSASPGAAAPDRPRLVDMDTTEIGAVRRAAIFGFENHDVLIATYICALAPRSRAGWHRTVTRG